MRWTGAFEGASSTARHARATDPTCTAVLPVGRSGRRATVWSTSTKMVRSAQAVIQASTDTSRRVTSVRQVASCRALTITTLRDADRLTMLGPMCIIASLSIGATRTFRIRRVAAPDQPHGSTSSSEPAVHAAQQRKQPLVGPTRSAPARLEQPAADDPQQPLSRSACLQPTTVDIELKHNSLVIMWPPMQEEWKHEVSARPP